ncbi:MAG: chemotaxis protein CheA [Bdellovibrionales bacterium]
MAQLIDQELLDCFVIEASDALINWEKICLSTGPSNVVESLDAIFRVAHNLKGSSRSIGLEEFGQFIHKVEDYIGQLKTDPSLVNENVIRRLLQAQSFIMDWLTGVQGNPTLVPDYEPVLKLLTGEGGGSAESHAPLPTAGLEVKRQEAAPKANALNETIRVKSQKLDQLIQVIGELGIQQAITSHCVKMGLTHTSDFLKSLNMVSKMAKEIQAQSIALRMIELQGLFQRLERTGRELAGELNKKVEFQIEGAELELDKIVIETITEPLIHIIRNALDHGIEPAELRADSSKSPVALVKLSARKDTDSVIITIKDDGKGIDPQKILAKAVENGLVRPESKLTDADCLQLIFMPGFSTAEKVTSVSGRGVGMDVVRQAIDSVRGRVEIQSEVGKGSSFVINIPTSMNIIDAIVVEVRGEKYVIPLNNILEVIDLSANEVKSESEEDADVLKLRDQLIPLEKLDAYLQMRSTELQPKSSQGDHRPAIISSSKRGPVAFRVDRVIGQQRVIVKPLMGRESYPAQVSGTTVLSDGKPGFIVSLSSLADAISAENFSA